MENNKKLFEGLLKADGIDPAGATESERIAFENMLDEQSKSKQSKPSTVRPGIWRIIMKSKITKLAVAAVIIIAVVLSITILDKAVTPAWAIEDTANMLDQFNAVHISGVVNISIEKFGGGEDLVIREGKQMSIEIWAQANEQRTESENIRMETGDGAIGAVYNTTTYIYDPNSNALFIRPDRKSVKLSPWPTGDFLKAVQEDMNDWQVLYGKDAATGRDYAFVTCSNPSQNQSWWLEIDLETNLPVRFKGWNNTRREGAPSMNFQRIIFFEELPDEMFEFQIPEGAQIVDF